MAAMTVREIAQAAGGRLVCGSPDRVVTGIETDSRKAGPGTLFVPVIGERADGHRFIPAAMAAGAEAAFTSEHGDPGAVREEIARAGGGRELEERAWICVEDTVAALQALGAFLRDRVKIPVIGVTGSVGKTTNREMIACALSGGFHRVFKTAGNRNSQVGVPITLWEISPEDEIAVLELGMSEPGEMARIARAAKVDMAAVTNIGIAHIGQLGSRENICREKLRIQDGMRDGGILFLNGDDAILRERRAKEGCRTVYYGMGANCGYRAVDVGTEEGFPVFTALCPDGETARVRLQVLGDHNVSNAMLALAVAKESGVELAAAAKALEGFSGYQGRQQVFETGTLTVIDDSYNASPASMKAGLEVLMRIHPGRRKAAVLADMKELGVEERAYHREIGRFLAEHREGRMADLVFLLGGLAEEIGREYVKEAPDAAEGVYFFSDKEELARSLEERLRPGDCVLFKGSNSMGLGSLAARFSGKRQ